MIEQDEFNQSPREETSSAGHQDNQQAGASATGTSAAAAPARALSPDEEKTTMNLFKIVNGQISQRVDPLTLSYNEQEVTVLSIHWNGIHCRDENGAAIVVPGEWQYLKEIFSVLD
jgi:hypothetical protein